MDGLEKRRRSSSGMWRASSPQYQNADRPRTRGIGRAIVAMILSANVLVIFWLWLYDGGITGVHNVAGVFTSTGRITGLLGAYALLIQLLLLARIRPVERLIGFDRLTVWHRVNGMMCFYLILAHIVLICIGYAVTDHLTIVHEIGTLVGTYSGMYAAAAAAASYWTALYLVTLATLILYRLVIPVVNGFRHQMRVAEIDQENPNVVSLRITGRHLDRMGARAGQFFLWRFMTPKLVWQSHPFSLSAAPDGQSLRITIKNLGDFTSRIGAIPPGTRVVGVGPFGLFTDAVRQRDRVAMIAGGVGITPIRALIEEMPGDLVLLYRVMDDGDVVFRDELDQMARERGIEVHYVLGSHRAPGNEHLLSPAHLRELVPDITGRDVYVCGPPALASLVENNVRAAGVPSKYIHSESFAFAPGAKPSGGGPRRSLPTRRSTGVSILAATAALGAGIAWLITTATSGATCVTIASTNKRSPVPVAQPTAVPSAIPSAKATPQRPAATPTPKTPNGRYAGSIVTEQYGAVQASIVVVNGKITNVLVTAPQDNPRSSDINSQAVPVLRAETLQAQSATVNEVSGATFTSNAYIQSLQAALVKAHL